jgi:TPR repeat protein
MRLKRVLCIVAMVFVSASEVVGQTAGTVTLRKILADRPEMQAYTDSNGVQHAVSENDSIFIAAARLLTNDEGAGPVDWSDIPPQKQCEAADHMIAQGSHHALIRLGTVELCNAKQGQPIGFEELWHGLFYELFNIQNDAGFIEDYSGALSGKYSECEFILASTRREYRAVRLVSEFYHDVFKPWAQFHGFNSDGNEWLINLPPTFEQWIVLYKDPRSYPWDYWGKYYKEGIVTYLVARHIPVPVRGCNGLPVLLGDSAYTDERASGAAADNSKGDEAMRGQRYTEAFSSYQKACSEGMMLGCRNLGELYHEGLGVEKDFGKAQQCFAKACDGGNMWGCNSLAWMYENGEGMPKDAVKAASLFQQSCNGEEAKGCNNLGRMLEKGDGIALDLTKAAEYYKLACDENEGWGCYNLGKMYGDGRGVEKSPGQEHLLMIQACKLGIAEGCKTKAELEAQLDGAAEPPAAVKR